MNQINWVDFNSSKYFAFPKKSLPIYFNVTSLEARAYVGALFLASVGKSPVWRNSPEPTKQSLSSSSSLFTFSEESEAVGKVLGYTPTSIYEWLRSLGLVAYTGIIPGYYVTFPDNKVQNAYFNSTSDVFPLAYTLTGAALVAYVSKSVHDRDCFVGFG